MVEDNKDKTTAAPANAPTTLRVIMGRKLGMTQVFTKTGMVIPVTVLEMGPNPILRLRTKEKDGYAAVQVGYGERREKSLTQSELGQFKKAGVKPTRWVKEFRVPDLKGFEVGQSVTLAERFAPGDYVDVQGTSKGIGFAGVMKRHNFAGLEASHGASDKERSPGSIASRRSLGRVMPGQRMAGHKGNATSMAVKLEVVEVHPRENKILVKGAVPGVSKSNFLVLKETTRPIKKKIVRKVATKKKGKK